MAPLLEATAYKLVSSTSSSATYEGNLDSEWLIGDVANGGYSLSIINVCSQDYLANQLQSTHKDPFHITATYLNATDSKASWLVEIQVMKRGKGFTNMSANLTQKSSRSGESTIRIQANLIFTDFARLQADESTEPFTIKAGSKYQLPSFNKSEPREYTRNLFADSSKIHYWRRLALYRDEKADMISRQEGRLSTASWMEFPIEKVPEKDTTHFNNAAIIFLPDTVNTEIGLIAEGGKVSSKDVWLPTMFLSIELKRALPDFPLLKVNSLTRTRHVDHGRFEEDVEIWSHPDDAERLQLPFGVKSVILCISRQVALTIPLTVQASIVARRRANL